MIIFACLIFILGGCGLKSNESLSNVDIKDKLFLKHANEKKAYNTITEVADRIIISAKSDDYNSISELFSNYSHNNNSTLDEEIKEFCKYCNFEFTNNDMLLNSSGSNGKEKILHYYSRHIMTDDMGKKYVMHIGWVANDTTDTSKIGIQYIDIIKYENCKEGIYKDFDDKPGVYILD